MLAVFEPGPPDSTRRDRVYNTIGVYTTSVNILLLFYIVSYRNENTDAFIRISILNIPTHGTRVVATKKSRNRGRTLMLCF